MLAVDPCFKEEGAMSGNITVVVDPQGHICGANKTNGIGLSMLQLMRSVRLAVSKAAELGTALHDALQSHEANRIKAAIRRKDEALSVPYTEGRKTIAMKASIVEINGMLIIEFFCGFLCYHLFANLHIPMKGELGNNMRFSAILWTLPYCEWWVHHHGCQIYDGRSPIKNSSQGAQLHCDGNLSIYYIAVSIC